MKHPRRGKTEVFYSSYVKKARKGLEKSYDVNYPVPPKRNVVLVQGIEGAHRAHYTIKNFSCVRAANRQIIK